MKMLPSSCFTEADMTDIKETRLLVNVDPPSLKTTHGLAKKYNVKSCAKTNTLTLTLIHSH